MMDLKSIFSNPWVLGGGLVLGVILLVSKGSGSSNSGDAGNLGSTLTSLEIAADVNKAGMQLSALQAGIAGDIAQAQIATDAGLLAGFVNTLGGLKNQSMLIQAQIAESNAGVYKTISQSIFAARMDRQANANRIAMGTLEADMNLAALRIENGDNTATPQIENGISKINKHTSDERELYGMRGYNNKSHYSKHNASGFDPSMDFRIYPYGATKA